MLKLHLGCGEIVLDGWLNVDAIAKRPGVVVADLTMGLPWSAADRIYNEHFLEHLTRDQGQRFLTWCAAILKERKGWLRISTPDLDVIVRDYLACKLDRIDRSVWAPETPARMVNEAMRLWGHQFLYDAAELRVGLLNAGFTHVIQTDYHDSTVAEFEKIDQRPDCGEAIFFDAGFLA